MTASLDEGLIIEQDVVRISHRDQLQDIIRKGRDLERHLEHRILVYANKSVVFV